MTIRIFFCGEVVADMVGQKDQQSDTFKLSLGGSQFNGASGAVRAARNQNLDYEISFVGPLAKMGFGINFFNAMTERGINTSYLTRVDRNTTLSVVARRSDGTNDYMFYRDNTAEEQTKRSELPDSLGEPGEGMICCFGSISTIMEPARHAWLSFAKSQRGKALLFYDLNTRPSVAKDPERYRKLVLEWAKTIDVMKASDEDIAWAYPGMSLAEVAKIWMDAGSSMAVFTKSADGSEIFTRQLHAAVATVKLPGITNTVGAGDNFNAGIVIQLAKHGVFSAEEIPNLTQAQLETIISGGNRTAAAHLTAQNGIPLPAFPQPQ